MSRSRSSRSGRKADDADVSYEVETPFFGKTSTIYLFANDDQSVEVLIGNIPVPYFYHDNYNTDNREDLDQHAVSRWILEDSASELDPWEYNTSSSRSNSGNYYLQDVYFECERSDVNKAVLASKRFLVTLEEKVVAHIESIDKPLSYSPLQDLPDQ